jgi:glycosyltransferase involved in cell wall biosynthesis
MSNLATAVCPPRDAGPPRRLRVAFLTLMPSPYVQDLFEAIQADGRVEPRVFYMEQSAPDTYWGRVSLPDYASILPGRGFQVAGIRTHVNPGAWRTIADWRPDVVVVAGYTSVTCHLVMNRLRKSGLPWIFWAERPGVRGRNRLLGGLRKFALGRALRGPSGIAAIGQMAQEAYAKSSDAACPIHNTPYCCEVEDYFAIDPADRGTRGTRSILYCGQLIERKGVDVLLDAFTRIADKLPDATLSFLGTGPLKDALAARVDPRLRDRVIFAGFHPVAELPPYFARADLFVLPSRHDGWGVVTNQAIAAGLPVVASDAVGAAAELVRPDENGYVVPAGDAAALADAMLRALDSPETLRRMSQASRQLAQEIRPSAIVERWVRLFAEVCPNHEFCLRRESAG